MSGPTSSEIIMVAGGGRHMAEMLPASKYYCHPWVVGSVVLVDGRIQLHGSTRDARHWFDFLVEKSQAIERGLPPPEYAPLKPTEAERQWICRKELGSFASWALERRALTQLAAL